MGYSLGITQDEYNIGKFNLELILVTFNFGSWVTIYPAI